MRAPHQQRVTAHLDVGVECAAMVGAGVVDEILELAIVQRVARGQDQAQRAAVGEPAGGLGNGIDQVVHRDIRQPYGPQHPVQALLEQLIILQPTIVLILI